MASLLHSQLTALIPDPIVDLATPSVIQLRFPLTLRAQYLASCLLNRSQFDNGVGVRVLAETVPWRGSRRRRGARSAWSCTWAWTAARRTSCPTRPTSCSAGC